MLTCDENNLRKDFQRRHPYISFVRLQELSNNIITESFVGGVNRSSARCLFYIQNTPVFRVPRFGYVHPLRGSEETFTARETQQKSGQIFDPRINRVSNHLAKVKALSIGSNLAVSSSNWEGVMGRNVLRKSYVVEQKKFYQWCQYVLL